MSDNFDQSKIKRLAVAVLTLLTASALCAVEDLSVNAGESQTLSGTAQYGNIIVNGMLVLAADADIKANSICVATNIPGTASLILEENAKFTLAGDNCKTMFGAAGGTAYVELKSGAHFNAHTSTVVIAYDPGKSVCENLPHFKMVVSNAIFETKGSMYISGNRTGSPDETVSEIRLDKGAALKIKNFTKPSKHSAKILFNGGNMKTSTWNGSSQFVVTSSNNGSVMALEGTNGCPVSLTIDHRQSAVFAVLSKSAVIDVCGDGDFVIDGKESLNLVSQTDDWNSNVRFRNTGLLRFAINQMNIPFTGLLPNSQNSPAHDIVVGDKTILDIKGSEISARSLAVLGSGMITNSVEKRSKIILGIGDEDCVISRKIPHGIDILKTGSGTLAMFASDVGNIEVAEGNVKFMSRDVMGYPIYRFNVYNIGNSGSSNARVRIGELNFLIGDKDVTQGWDALYYDHTGTSYYNEPLAMFDGDLATYFYDQRAQSFNHISNIHVSLEYVIPRRMTGYRWNRPVGSDLSSHSGWPTSWAVLGSEDNMNWRMLSLVENVPTSWDEDWREYPCTNYPSTAATVSALSVANGVTVSVCGPEFTLESAEFPSTAILEVSNGATITLPAASKISNLLIDRDAGGGKIINLNPSEEGAVYVLNGEGSVKGELPVTLINPVSTVLSKWKVYLDGELCPGVALSAVDGKLQVVNNLGFIISVR